MTRTIRGVLFDMDDTLIDWHDFHERGDWRATERAHLQNLVDYLARAGTPLAGSPDAFFHHYGNRVRDAWAQARTSLRAPHLGIILMEVLAAFGCERLSMDEALRIYDWTPVPLVKLFSDVPPALSALVARGYQIGIVTNAFQPMALRDIELDHYDLLRYFPNKHARVSAADAGYLKPSPSIFERALHALDLRPEQVVFVGDNPVADIAGSQGTGMKAILRRVAHTPPMVNGLVVPDAVVDDFSTLLDIIEAWN